MEAETAAWVGGAAWFRGAGWSVQAGPGSWHSLQGWDHRPSALLMASVPTEPVRPPLEAAVPGGHAARMLPQGPGDVRGLAGSTLLSLSGGRQSEHGVPGAGGRPCCPGCPAPGWRQAAQRPPASVSSAPGLRRAEVSDVIRGLRLSIPASGARAVLCPLSGGRSRYGGMLTAGGEARRPGGRRLASSASGTGPVGGLTAGQEAAGVCCPGPA